MNKTTFQPKPSLITLAMWEYLGRLTPPTKPTAGISWGAYIASGAPSRYIGRG